MNNRRRPLKYFIREKALEAATTGYCTICEVQRQCLKIVEDELLAKEPDAAKRLIALIEEAYDLGKRMDRKLREYSSSYHHAEVAEAIEARNANH